MKIAVCFWLILSSTVSIYVYGSDALNHDEVCDITLDTSWPKWNEDTIAKGLLILHDFDYQFRSTEMKTSSDSKLDRQLSKKLGFETTVSRLYRAAVSHYGSLQEAIDESEIDFEIENQYGVPSQWTKPLIKRALRLLYNEKYTPNVDFLTKNRDKRPADLVSKSVGFKTSLSSIYVNANRLYKKGLYGALEEADLPVKFIVAPKEGSYWNKRSVVKGLKILYETGYDINPKALNKEKDPTATRLLTKNLGFPATAVMLYVHALKLYEDFPAALKAAELPAELILLRPSQDEYWTKEKVRLGLLALVKSGLEINAKNLRATNERNNKILTDAVGFRARTRNLGEKAGELFGSIQNALWTREMVHAALQAIYREGYLPNANFFTSAEINEKLTLAIKGAIGFKPDRFTIYSQAMRFYDNNFKAALAAAGLPVEKIYHVKPSQPWTKQLVHQCLLELYQAGYKPKLYFLQNSTDINAKEIVVKTTGFETTLSTLLTKAKEFHDGSFNNALREAKLPVDEILALQPRNPWSKELTHAALKALHENGFVPSASFLQKQNDPAARKILIETVGFEAELSTLYLKTCEFHDNDFQAGVIAAGLPIEKIASKFSGRYWTKELTHLGLKVLFESGLRPNFSFLMHGESSEAEILLKEALGFPVTLTMLGKKVREFHHDDFEMALREAGLPVNEIVYRKRSNRLTTRMIIEGFTALYANGFLPNSGLLHSQDSAATRLLAQTLGFKIPLSQLHDEAIEKFGPDLIDVYRALGLPADQINAKGSYHRYWTKSFIIDTLKAVQQAGFTPYAPYLRRAENPVLNEILERRVGYPIRLSALYIQAEGQFGGSYAAAIKSAGLPIEKIILQPNQEWSEDLVLAALKTLYQNGFRPSYTGLMANNVEAMRITSDAVGFLTTNRILYKQARTRFGSLRNALIKAKLPADEIISRMSSQIDYTVTMPIHRESVFEDGELHSRNYIGDAPLTPEEIALDKELRSVTIGALPTNMRGLGIQIIDVIFSLEVESLTPIDIYQVLLKENPLVELSDVQRVLSTLQGNQVFRNYLLKSK